MTCRAMTLLAAVLVTALVTRAFGHALLEHAEPAVGSKVHEPPRTVCLHFSEPIEPAFSSVQVLDRNGERVDGMDARVDSSAPTRFCVSLARAGSGSYTVVWRVVSADNHMTNGDFTFEVAPP